MLFLDKFQLTYWDILVHFISKTGQWVRDLPVSTCASSTFLTNLLQHYKTCGHFRKEIPKPPNPPAFSGSPSLAIPSLWSRSWCPFCGRLSFMAVLAVFSFTELLGFFTRRNAWIWTGWTMLNRLADGWKKSCITWNKASWARKWFQASLSSLLQFPFVVFWLDSCWRVCPSTTTSPSLLRFDLSNSKSSLD